MMAKKDRFPSGYSGTLAHQYELKGLDSSDIVDSTEESSAVTGKWMDLNYKSKDSFDVPIETIPLSKLSSNERKNLCLRFIAQRDQIRLLENKVKSWNQETRGFSSALGSLPLGKEHGFNRGFTGKFEPAEHAGLNCYGGLLEQCGTLLKKLMVHKHAWVFNQPVDAVALNIPDYFDIIKCPMDLGTIKSNLETGKYHSPMEFLADVRLTFTNAKMYNPAGSDVHIMAGTMSKLFETRWRMIEKRIPAEASVIMDANPGNIEHVGREQSMTHSKKRKLSPTLHEVRPVLIKQKMTDEEKQKIGSELEELMDDLPAPIEDFLRARCSNRDAGPQDEIELDMDDLSDDVLFTLRRLLNDHFQLKKKNFKAEACEIELPNLSVLSNSSLQVDNVHGDIDEDVDIGSDESPVTSYPPLVIEKGACIKAEEPTEAASVDGLDHKKQDFRSDLSITHSDGQDGETANSECQVSPDKLYRAALLKNRYADTIVKALEKTLTQDDKADPEKIRREREMLELQKQKEKARLEAEARAAEDARRQAEEKAEAEAKRKREVEREAARVALLKMEKTVELENSRFLEDLEMLRVVVPGDQLLTSVDEASPDTKDPHFGDFNFIGNNALEQLGLYMKRDDAVEEEDIF